MRGRRCYEEARGYVRWQRKKRVDHWKLGPLLCAVLVESRRVDGEPRQRTVAYLGSIRESFIDEGEMAHRALWQHADERLDELALDPEARAKVEAAVDSRVRRVTPENQAEFDAARALRELEIAAQFAKIFTPA